jgi:serine/threonine protein phosphatase 1
MAIYVTSDLHGLAPETLEQLLAKAGFSDADWLYILGDVIDRQNDGGVEMLKWLLYQPNVQLILGNHEAMLLSCDFVFDEITEDSIRTFSKEKMELLQNYMANGGDVTLKALRELNQSDRETLLEILDYLRDCPLYETVSAGGKDFVLVHGGLENFSPTKKLSEYTADELIWCWPEITDEYFDDVVTVFGHTPTMSYDKEKKGKILHTRTWIDIDVGIPYGNPPALLRLDDLSEFYL